MYMVSYPRTVISLYLFVTDADLNLHMSYVFVSVSYEVHAQVICFRLSILSLILELVLTLLA